MIPNFVASNKAIMRVMRKVSCMSRDQSKAALAAFVVAVNELIMEGRTVCLHQLFTVYWQYRSGRNSNAIKHSQKRFIPGHYCLRIRLSRRLRARCRGITPQNKPKK